VVTYYDPGSDPAVRIFPSGSHVLFAFQILNAKANQQKLPQLGVHQAVPGREAS
jgi:hypothetical protein